MTDSHTSTLHHNLPPSSEPLVIKPTALENEQALAEVLYCPEQHSLVTLSATDLDILNDYAQQYNQPVEQLLKAQQNGTDAQKQQAKAAVSQKLDALVKGGGIGDVQWYELHSLNKKRKIYLMPGEFLAYHKHLKIRRFYPLEGQPGDINNAFGSLKTPTGDIDPEKFKDAFKQATAEIKAEWNIKSGQVSVKTIMPGLAAWLLDDELTALDNWIAGINETLKWQSSASDKRRKVILEHLQAEPLTLEDYSKANRLAQETWDKENPIAGYTFDLLRKAPQIKGQKYNSARQDLIHTVEQIPLPTARWDASAEANLMRYSMGASTGLAMDLTKGVICAEAKAEMDIALAEGKLQGALYYPDTSGHEAKVTMTVKTKKGDWQVFDRAVPNQVHFDVDSEFINLWAVTDIFESLRHWELLKKTIGQNKYQLTIIGHTSAPGTREYNRRLSQRRAQVVYGLLSNNPRIWEIMFIDQHWGDVERIYMRTAIQKLMPQSDQQQTDRQLISAYFKVCHNYYQLGDLKLPTLVQQEFARNYILPLGETELMIDTPQEERLNRRVEFVLYELVGETATEAQENVSFGHLRLKFEGHVGGYVGVNASVSAAISINARQGSMEFQGTQAESSRKESPAMAEGKFAAFAGAKVEAGLKAALDWRKPQEHKQAMPDWNTLGSLGYIVNGYLGAALQGSFQIGYDTQIQRFVIRAQASLCIGAGAGGKVDFTVDAKQVWAFIDLVYNQLRKADFSVIDFFQDEIYDRFVAWSYELMKQGYLFQGMAMRGGIEVANQAVQLLDVGSNIYESFATSENESDSLEQLIDYLKHHASAARYAPPEVKGRVLYRLLETEETWWHRWGLTDYDREREEAVQFLLTEGVVSKREYQEVLEHTLGRSIAGRSEAEKCRHASQVQETLLNFMNDKEDRAALTQWWDTLPDPGQCSCSSLQSGLNPFHR
ncbi:OmpA family protein [Gynuella sunshinyii]|uniref:Outer membrane protein and related peptidoglycan-associated (Lipo)protein n=1 Tax=Gynuella sunshinyii YC6258 TaxID=1445510 RepID=A0A0C5VTB7_9GAMM|nr:OmpA family protein [Gynuella sunshinyii]AJQ97922.1 outer membrane protein and related peptidoglycan-associated (lipo)protein [Gynuella sunshinyii YC6258]